MFPRPAHPAGLMMRLRGLLLFLLLAVPARAADLPKVGVLVDPSLSKDALAALLEQHIAGRKELAVLDRSQLKLIIDEALIKQLAGDNRGQRLKAIGDLKLADALVVVRRHEKGVEAVLCETRRGLRLLRLPVTDVAGAENGAAEIARRLPALMNQDAQVWAVPPLISRNLTSEHDHLRASLAGVIEETLTARGDILCVELAEAKAFADEIALGGPAVSRHVPYYVLGEFRHTSRRADATVNLTLELTQGTKSLHKLTADNTPPEKLSTIVPQHVGLMIEKTGGQPRQFDPAAEAQLLARRAAAFSTISNYQEPVDLIETAILLQPKNAQYRRDAVVYYDRLINSLFVPFNRLDDRRPKPESWYAMLITAARLYTRSVDHLAPAFAAVLDGKDQEKEGSLLARYSAKKIISDARELNGKPPAAVVEAITELLAVERERMTPLYAREASQSKWRRSNALNGRYYFFHAPQMEDDRRMAHVMAVARHLVDDEKNGEAIWYLFSPPMELNWAYDGVPVEKINALHDFAREQMEQLKALPQKNAPAWIAYVETRRAAIQAEQLRLQAPKPKSTATSKPAATRPAIAQANLTLKPLDSIWPPAIRASLARKSPLQYWTPISADTSVVGTFNDVAVMKGLDDVRTLKLPQGTSSHNVQFDGQYLWVLSNAEPLLVELATEKAHRVAVKNVLPPADRGINIVPVAPREAVVFGAFGNNDGAPSRSWIAMLTVDANMTAAAEVVHEAMDQEPADVYMPATRQPLPTEVFHVNYGTTCVRKGGKVTHVILARDYVFDVEKRKFSTLKPVFNYLARATMDDGYIWHLKTPGSSIDTKPLQLVRVQPPDFKIEVVEKAIPFHGQNQPPTALFPIGDRILMRRDRQYYVYDRPSRQFAELPIPKDLLNQVEGAGDWWTQQPRWVQHAGQTIVFNPITGKTATAVIEMPEKGD